jgi:Icc protein
MGVNTENNFKQVLARAFSQHQSFDLVLLTGDLAQEPTEKTYRHICDLLAPYSTTCLALPGNHDDAELLRKAFSQLPFISDKQLLLNGWKIICLDSQRPDSQGGRLPKPELNFLQQALEQDPEKPTLIAVHHHCLPTHCRWLDTMIIENQAQFLALLCQYPQVKLVVSGHIHQVMDKQHQHIQVLGTPASCFQFKAHSEHFSIDTLPPGYRVLMLHDNGQIDSEVFWLAQQDPGLDLTLTGY